MNSRVNLNVKSPVRKVVGPILPPIHWLKPPHPSRPLRLLRTARQKQRNRVPVRSKMRPAKRDLPDSRRERASSRDQAKSPAKVNHPLGPGEQPGSGTGKQPALAQSGNSQSESPGENGAGTAPGQNGKPGKQSAQGQASTQGVREGPPGGPRRNNGLAAGGRNFFEGGATGPNEQEDSPLTGTDFRDWSDRLSEVEEIVENSQVRNDIARIQDRARATRSEFKREGKKPDWAVVRSEILSPLVEVRARIDQELSRLQSQEAMVPVGSRCCTGEIY